MNINILSSLDHYNVIQFSMQCFFYSEKHKNIFSWDNPLFNYKLYIYYIMLFKDIQICIYKDNLKEILIKIVIQDSDINHNI